MIYVATSVWGKVYLDTFLDVCLPSMLVGSNLDHFAKKMPVIFLIYTKDEDVAYVKSKLPSVVNIEFNIIPFSQFGNNDFLPQLFHSKVTESYLHAINTEKEKSAPIIFVYPDHFFSSGVGKRIDQSLQRGKKCLVLLTSRVNEQEFITQLREQFPNFSQDSIEPKQLVRLMLDNMHLFSKTQFAELKEGNIFASMRFWGGVKNICIAKAFHVHPLLIAGNLENISSGATVDGEIFLREVIGHFDAADAIQDTAECVVCELTAKQSMQPQIMHQRMSLLRLFAKSLTGPFNRQIFHKFSMTFYSEEIDKKIKKELHDKMEKETKTIMQWIESPNLIQHLIYLFDRLTGYPEYFPFHRIRKKFLAITLYIKMKFPSFYRIMHRILRGKREIRSLDNINEMREYLGK